MSEVDVDVDRVHAVLARWFPHHGISLNRAVPGISTPVFQAHIEGETEICWVRIGEQAGERRDGEIVAHRVLVASDIPVPAVIGYEAAPAELDRSLALTAHIPGIPLAERPSGEGNASLAIETGRILARINRLPVHGFGWAYAASEGDLPVGEHATRAAWCQEYREAADAVRLSGLLDARTMSTVERVIDDWAERPDHAAGALAHGDFDSTHIYVDPDRCTLTGIIDFGEIRGADPLYDLGHLLLHDGESFRPNLFPEVLDGYAEIVDLPEDAMGEVRIQAIAVGTRALARQLARAPSPYRGWLISRLGHLADMARQGLRRNDA